MINNRYPLLVILGPTAVGKTELSLSLAHEVKGEIISADSMQVYRGLDIGTAKVSPDERKEVPHHLIDIIEPDQEFSVADFQEMVDRLIPQICNRGRLPMMVGGTGLYIKAVVEGFMLPEMETDRELRRKLRKKAREYGNKHVHQMLEEIDPELAAKLHPNDLRRIIRGIEIYHQTGQTKTYFKKKQEKESGRYRALKIGLLREREELYQRINQRVDKMIADGLIAEVKSLLAGKTELSKTARQALGYKEIIDFLNGEYDLEEAVRLIKRDTRHYAKKQLTWFKRDDDIHWLNCSELSSAKIFTYTRELIRKFNAR